MLNVFMESNPNCNLSRIAYRCDCSRGLDYTLSTVCCQAVSALGYHCERLSQMDPVFIAPPSSPWGQ